MWAVYSAALVGTIARPIFTNCRKYALSIKRVRADITKRRLARLMDGRDPRTDQDIGRVTIPCPQLFDDLSEYGAPIDIDPRYLGMPILMYYMAR